VKHDEIWHLLPWFVNGRLLTESQAEVDAHLRTCLNCRAEVKLQMQIRDATGHEKSRDSSAEEGFDRLWARIAKHESLPVAGPATCGREKLSARAWRTPQRPAQSPVLRWLIAAVIVEAVGLVTLAAMRTHAVPVSAPALYQTLSSAAPEVRAGSIRAVFSGDLALHDLQSLLSRAQLRIVDGPTDAGVYTLASDDTHRVESTLADLRRNAAVRFAEPIGDAGASSP